MYGYMLAIAALQEEKAADQKLSALAEGSINYQAAAMDADGPDRNDEDGEDEEMVGRSRSVPRKR